jgi:hypothetical protein|uniref:Uncharacterized protein n=1 Tax=viral metagenome TaxID=1070528 RepID=A0A6C0DZ32_9ZZZZ
MSSNSNSKPPTNGETSTLTSKMASAGSGMIGVIIFSLVSVGMFIGAFVSMSNFVGSKDDWNLIKPQITKIWILTLIGTFGLIIAALLYFIQDSARTIYFILVLSCLTLGLSFSSLAIAAISR